MVKLVVSKRWRIAYRILVILLCAFAIFSYVDARLVYGVNSFYFPKESHLSDAIHMYAWLVGSILLLGEALSLFVFRKFSRRI
jgi:hypothetical protein